MVSSRNNSQYARKSTSVPIESISTYQNVISTEDNRGNNITDSKKTVPSHGTYTTPIHPVNDNETPQFSRKTKPFVSHINNNASDSDEEYVPPSYYRKPAAFVPTKTKSVPRAPSKVLEAKKTTPTLPVAQIQAPTIDLHTQWKLQQLNEERKSEAYSRRLLPTKEIERVMERCWEDGSVRVERRAVKIMREVVADMMGEVCGEAMQRSITAAKMYESLTSSSVPAVVDGDDIIDALRALGFPKKMIDVCEHGLYFHRIRHGAADDPVYLQQAMTASDALFEPGCSEENEKDITDLLQIKEADELLPEPLGILPITATNTFLNNSNPPITSKISDYNENNPKKRKRDHNLDNLDEAICNDIPTQHDHNDDFDVIINDSVAVFETIPPHTLPSTMMSMANMLHPPQNDHSSDSDGGNIIINDPIIRTPMQINTVRSVMNEKVSIVPPTFVFNPTLCSRVPVVQGVNTSCMHTLQQPPLNHQPPQRNFSILPPSQLYQTNSLLQHANQNSVRKLPFSYGVSDNLVKDDESDHLDVTLPALSNSITSTLFDHQNGIPLRREEYVRLASGSLKRQRTNNGGTVLLQKSSPKIMSSITDEKDNSNQHHAEYKHHRRMI